MATVQGPFTVSLTEADLDEALDTASEIALPDTGFPLGRLVALLGPYVSLLAGSIATWLVAKVDVLGIPGLNQANLATGVAAAITFVLVTAITYASHHKWLDGNSKWETALLDAWARAHEADALKVATAPRVALAPSRVAEPNPDPLASGAHPDGDDYDAGAEAKALNEIDVEAGTNVPDDAPPVSPDVDR
jgi:hypothetical protein